MPTKNLPGFIAALGAVFRKADPQMLEDLADTFDPSSDFRQAQTTVPDRDSLKTGPAEPMSGQGARRMTKDYSFGATNQDGPQTGLSRQYADFDGLFPADDDAYLNKAADLLRSARKSIVKADIMESMDGDTDDAEAKAGHSGEIDRAVKMLTAAKKILSAAADDGEETERFPDATKSLTDRLKALSGRIKAGTAAKAAPNFAARADGGMSVAQLLNVVAGHGGAGLSMPPDMSGLAKASVSLADRIEAAFEAGALTDLEEIEASSVAQYVELVKAGQVPAGELQGRIMKASPKVRGFLGLDVVPAKIVLN